MGIRKVFSDAAMLHGSKRSFTSVEPWALYVVARHLVVLVEMVA